MCDTKSDLLFFLSSHWNEKIYADFRFLQISPKLWWWRKKRTILVEWIKQKFKRERIYSNIMWILLIPYKKEFRRIIFILASRNFSSMCVSMLNELKFNTEENKLTINWCSMTREKRKRIWIVVEKSRRNNFTCHPFFCIFCLFRLKWYHK